METSYLSFPGEIVFPCWALHLRSVQIALAYHRGALDCEPVARRVRDTGSSYRWEIIQQPPDEPAMAELEIQKGLVRLSSAEVTRGRFTDLEDELQRCHVPYHRLTQGYANAKEKSDAQGLYLVDETFTLRRHANLSEVSADDMKRMLALLDAGQHQALRRELEARAHPPSLHSVLGNEVIDEPMATCRALASALRGLIEVRSAAVPQAASSYRDQVDEVLFLSRGELPKVDAFGLHLIWGTLGASGDPELVYLLLDAGLPASKAILNEVTDLYVTASIDQQQKLNVTTPFVTAYLENHMTCVPVIQSKNARDVVCQVIDSVQETNETNAAPSTARLGWTGRTTSPL